MKPEKVLFFFFSFFSDRLRRKSAGRNWNWNGRVNRQQDDCQNCRQQLIIVMEEFSEEKIV